MRVSLIFIVCLWSVPTMAQSALPDFFLDGKSVVLISNSPSARPILSFENLAHELHSSLVSAGGDPIAYYELEDIVLSEEIQSGYAAQFSKRLVKSIVLVTRKTSGQMEVHILPFSGTRSIVPSASSWSLADNKLDGIKEKLATAGNGIKTKNLLVIDVPEFLAPSSAANINYLRRNPLNLNTFKLAVPLTGAGGESGLLTKYRYDMLGRSEQEIAKAQDLQKAEIQQIMDSFYPHQVDYLTGPKTNAELIKDRTQFMLMRVEGREGDLMKTMGLSDTPTSPDIYNRIVIKYYIRFLVRDEQYIGPVWDADPNWKVALTNFLDNLKLGQ
ncbi:hypothetical protein [Anditalea andensis]|uniref:NTPase n=1 Tax=Anditalea andensis TaxID=1048983 RepID=A0A074LIA7_9BACT|nr:hypothetical protein [Anditalea andensis]KEO73512.1 hypothetical protein EL17_11445 [Anditalea andensis]